MEDRSRRRAWSAAFAVLLIGALLTPAAVVAITDTDHDGLSNTFERNWSLTNPRRWDTDRDGLSDGREDPDRDGLTNLTEQRLGTNPRRGDTDGDGWSDGVELRALTDARSATSHPRPKPKPTPTPTPGSTPTPSPTPTPGATPTPTPGATPTPAATPTPSPSPTPTPSGGGAPTLPGAPSCPIFPASNVWNVRVDGRAVAADSATMINSIGLDRGLHMDFGSYAGYGIPYDIVTATTPRSMVAFDYADESDQVGYPIPTSPSIEGGSDHHILMVDKDACQLYELFDARKVNGLWAAGSGATWDLRSNALRPAGWTSADAAGLPILPGLVRYDEALAGAIQHALRFTASQTRRAYIYPARHFASTSTSTSLPPMGLRVRLKASFNTAGLSPQARVIAVALQRYGMILADNGSPWYITGTSNPGFDDAVLHELDVITGRDLEVVDTSGLVNGQ